MLQAIDFDFESLLYYFYLQLHEIYTNVSKKRHEIKNCNDFSLLFDSIIVDIIINIHSFLIGLEKYLIKSKKTLGSFIFIKRIYVHLQLVI